MIRNKALMTGIGIGLMVGALVIQLMVKADELGQSPIAAQLQELSMEQLKSQAESHQMKLVPMDQKTYSSQEIEDIKKKAAEDERKKLAAQPQSVATPAPAEAAKEKVLRTVYIPDRMDAKTVAYLLATAQVVPDAAKLVTTLEIMQLSGKIRSGVYTFEDSSDVTEVAKRITSEP